MMKRCSFSDKFQATVAFEGASWRSHSARDSSQAQGLSDAGDDAEKAGDRWPDGRVFR
jgi:hypothetical protein